MADTQKIEQAKKKAQWIKDIKDAYDEKVKAVDDAVSTFQLICSEYQKMLNCAKTGELYTPSKEYIEKFGKKNSKGETEPESKSKMKTRMEKWEKNIKEAKENLEKWYKKKMEAIEKADSAITDAMAKVNEVSAKMSADAVMQIVQEKAKKKAEAMASA